MLSNEHILLTHSKGMLATADDLYDTFVQPFPASETRKRLFHEWIKYNRVLSGMMEQMPDSVKLEVIEHV